MTWLTILSLAAAVLGQGPMICGPNGCRPANSRQVVPAPARSWVVWPENPDQAFLFLSGQCAGGVDFASRRFRSFDGSQWGEESDPPEDAPLPPIAAAGKPQELPTGVVWDKLADAERFDCNGKRCSKGEVFQLLKPRRVQQLADDSGRRHLSLCCRNAAMKKTVDADLQAGPLAELPKRYRVQVYDLSRTVDAVMLSPFKLPDDPGFKEKGFAAFLEEPDKDGKAKLLATGYGYDGPEGFAAWLRQADPSYDPGRNRPKVEPKAPDSNQGTPSARNYSLAAGGASLFVLFLLKLLAGLRGAKSNADSA